MCIQKPQSNKTRSLLMVGAGILICSMYSVSSTYAAWTNLTTTPPQETTLIQELGDVWEKVVTMVKQWLQSIPQVQEEWASPEVATWLVQEEYSEETVFDDITTSPYKQAIAILVQKWVINSTAKSFYPENHIKRGDAIKILVGLLQKNPKQVGVASFADVPTTSPYSTYVEYWYTAWLLDYMVVIKEGKRYFSPEKAMTEKEVESLLTDIPLLTLPEGKIYDNTYMTRGEYVQLVVASLWLLQEEPKQTQEEQTTSHIQSRLETLEKIAKTKEALSNL